VVIDMFVASDLVWTASLVRTVPWVGIAMQQYAQAEELSPGFGQEIILG
jgi:hypothetical protein